MLTFYYAAGTAAIPIHILLEDVGAEYQAKRIDFAKQEQQSPEYLAINPKGRVPALITPEGVLTEVTALLVYIAQCYPQQALIPSNAFPLAKAQEFNAYLSSTVHVAHAHKQRGSRWSDDPSAHESMKAKVAENMAECGRVIETHYFQGPWVLGDHYSICDPYLYWVGRLMINDGVPLDGFDKIRAHRERMMERPSVQKVNELHL